MSENFASVFAFHAGYSQLGVELLVGAEERLPVRLVALRLPAHLAFAIIVAPMLTRDTRRTV